MFDPILGLALMTMSSSIGFGIWQLRSVEKEIARSRAQRSVRR
jgi:hypothetical protein